MIFAWAGRNDFAPKGKAEGELAVEGGIEMELPEVECVFDMSRNIHCLKPKGSHVGLSGNEIEEAARRCNSHEKLANALNALNTYGNHLPKCKYLLGLKGQVIEDCDCGFEQALKEAKS